MAMMALGVLPVAVNAPPRRELALIPPTRHTDPLDIIEQGIGLAGLDPIRGSNLAPSPPPKKRPLDERKTRRAKRKQRRQR